MLQLQEGVLVEALLAVILAVVHAAAGDVRLAPVAGLVVEAGHWAHTDVLVHKVFVRKVVENLIVFNTSLLLSAGLGNRVKLVLDHSVHSVENSD